MSITAERIAELRRRYDGRRDLPDFDYMQLAADALNAIPALLDAAEEAERLRAENERLKRDNDALTSSMEDCVKDRLSELNAEAEAFDKECWNSLRQLCEDQPGFDWKYYDNELSASDAYEYLSECFAEDARLKPALTAANERVSVLEGLLRGAVDHMTGLPDPEHIAEFVARINAALTTPEGSE